MRFFSFPPDSLDWTPFGKLKFGQKTHCNVIFLTASEKMVVIGSLIYYHFFSVTYWYFYVYFRLPPSLSRPSVWTPKTAIIVPNLCGSAGRTTLRQYCGSELHLDPPRIRLGRPLYPDPRKQNRSHGSLRLPSENHATPIGLDYYPPPDWNRTSWRKIAVWVARVATRFFVTVHNIMFW